MDKNIYDFSLLKPYGDYKYSKLSAETINDLSIDFMVNRICHENSSKSSLKEILINMPVSSEVINYRNAVYDDLKNNEEFCHEAIESLDKLKILEKKQNRFTGEKSSIWQLAERLKELQGYSMSVIKIQEAFKNTGFKSDGMKQFKEYIQQIYNDSGFRELSDDIDRLGYDILAIKSMTIAVNFDDDLYPVEAGILSINDYYFREKTFIERFLSKHRKNNPDANDLNKMTMFTHSGDVTSNPLMNNLTDIVEKMLSKITADLKRTLKKYTDISGFALLKIVDELKFYEVFINLENKLRLAGMPCSYGKFSDEKSCFTDIYNIKLAICMTDGSDNSEMVYNDVEFSKNQRIFILTGPNRGGKTIFTQGIGLAFLMFQSGVFVPCSNCEMEICDGIYTHFPADENMTVELGRLGEEAKRLNLMCSQATSSSLLLLNESFATTSHMEALYIATDAVKYFCCLGARVCFNTHMHELAEKISDINSTDGAVCSAISLVMGMNGGERSYKVQISEPQGKSFAHDIAYKYGITFEQLKNAEHNSVLI